MSFLLSQGRSEGAFPSCPGKSPNLLSQKVSGTLSPFITATASLSSTMLNNNIPIIVSVWQRIIQRSRCVVLWWSVLHQWKETLKRLSITSRISSVSFASYFNFKHHLCAAIKWFPTINWLVEETKKEAFQLPRAASSLTTVWYCACGKVGLLSLASPTITLSSTGLAISLPSGRSTTMLIWNWQGKKFAPRTLLKRSG